MSEKRSWDIQPKRKAQSSQQQPAQSPARAVRPDRRIPMPRPMVRKPSPKPAARARREDIAESSATIIRREKVKQGKEREPLRARRRRARRRLSLVLSIIFVLLVAGAFAAIWSSAFRIQHVEAAGPDADGIQSTTMSSLAGTYKYVLPRNSIFFFPQDSLRAQILSQYPDVSAVSISLVSFDTIAIDSVPRESAFLWCGATYSAVVPAIPAAQTTPVIVSAASSTNPTIISPTPTQSPCYDADAQGDVFAVDSDASPDTLRIYDPLASSNAATSSPLGDDVGEASMIPNALQFVKAIKSIGVPIVALAIRGDEADLYAQSGTRITYVLGTEETTAETAESAFPSLNLNDGSLQYVDLRFQGKVYFKKNSGTAETSTGNTQ